MRAGGEMSSFGKESVIWGEKSDIWREKMSYLGREKSNLGETLCDVLEKRCRSGVKKPYFCETSGILWEMMLNCGAKSRIWGRKSISGSERIGHFLPQVPLVSPKQDSFSTKYHCSPQT